MQVSRMLGGTAVLAMLAVLPGLASADITVADVWADWQAQAQERGATLTATVTTTPGQIALTDIASATTTEGRVSRLRLSEVTLVQEGGAVAIRLPDQQRVRMESEDGTEARTLDGELRNPAIELRASGDPDDITYRYRAPTLSLTLVGASHNGTAEPDNGTDAQLTLDNAEGQQRNTLRAGQREVVHSGRVARVGVSGTLIMAAEEAAGTPAAGPGERVEAGLVIADLATSGTSRSPTGAFDASRLLRESEMEVSVSHGAVDASFTRGEATRLTLHAAGGRSETAYLNGRLTNAGGLDTGEITFSAAGLPAPPGLTFDGLTSSLAMPLVQSDTAQPYAVALSLDNFVGNAAAWELVDPGAVLPRDPGQLTVDLSGQMRITADLASEPEEVPFAVETLNVDALTLAVAGARLTGTGAFTISDMGSLPVGTADLALSGGERLLDGLVRIGLVPQAQAMMVRMVVGGFTRPGDGPDTLTSRLEFRADGAILANGRPIR